LIIILATILAFVGGVMWVFGRTLWCAVDANDPRKLLALEVFSTVSHRLAISQNGSESSATDSKSGTWVAQRHDDGEGAK
jgi:hypothetical protein